jgi:NitT/TauT family transport system permease protein
MSTYRHDPTEPHGTFSAEDMADADPGTLAIAFGAGQLDQPNRSARLRASGILVLERVAFGALLVGIWALVSHLKLIDPLVISNPSDVASYLGHAVAGSELWTNLWATLSATLIAFVLASVVGVAIGICLALLPSVERVVNPYLDAANAMPRIAFAPIFVIAFGLTINAKVALAFTVVVFILITSARAGVRSVDVEHMRLATVLGAKRRHMFTKILLPVATPSIFGGLRLGIIYALLGVVTSEIIASKNGIGQLLQQYAGTFQTAGIYGLLIVLAVVAVLLNMVTNRVERYFLRWQPPHGH